MSERLDRTVLSTHLLDDLSAGITLQNRVTTGPTGLVSNQVLEIVLFDSENNAAVFSQFFGSNSLVLLELINPSGLNASEFVKTCFKGLLSLGFTSISGDEFGGDVDFSDYEIETADVLEAVGASVISQGLNNAH